MTADLAGPAYCAVSACERPVRARGWCAAHYAQWKKRGVVRDAPIAAYANARDLTPCSVDGRTAPQSTRSWCRSHYDRWRRTGSPVPIPRTCQADGCDERGGYKGYCAFHRLRARRGVPLNAPRYLVPTGPCAVEGCQRDSETKRGWCRGHYDRFKRTGDVGPADFRQSTAITPDDVCAVDGCASPVVSRGWCNRHYKRWLSKGDPEFPVPARSVVVGRCAVDGCARWARSRGLCQAHYHRQRREQRRLLNTA